MIVTILVKQNSVVVTQKIGATLRQCDAIARIDGLEYQYIFKKDDLNTNKNWREQASSFAFYDAKNRGVFVVWLSSNSRPNKKRNIQAKNQLNLFELGENHE